MSADQARETEAIEPQMLGIDLGDLTNQLRAIVARSMQNPPSEGQEDLDEYLETTIARLQAAAREAQKRLDEQTRRISQLEQISTTDELTGIMNRRGFEEEFRRILAHARRHDEKGVLVYVDLDGFKPINDTHGHAAGDEVLRQVARILTESIRGSDFVARIGGDEFCVLLVETNRFDGVERAESLNRELNSAVITWNERKIALHASFGLQAFTARDSAQELLSCADAAMNRVKRLKKENKARQPEIPIPQPLADMVPPLRLGYAD